MEEKRRTKDGQQQSKDEKDTGMTIQIIIGACLIFFALCFYPFYKFLISRVQMQGWLSMIKQLNKKENGNVKEKKK
jgi:hypothetical protein